VSAILLSPWPESLYTFEQMWSRLAEHAHLVAIDLPGCGHSERRDELLKSSTMGQFIAHAVEGFELTRPQAVRPDGAVHRRYHPKEEANGEVPRTGRGIAPVFDNVNTYLWTGESGHPADAQT
jgi:pimeloyl-ACP methyl ester carboxylesterase